MLRQVYLMALKAWQAVCFRDIRGKRGSPVRGSVQASCRGTFRGAFWKLFGVFLDPFGSLGASFGRLLVNFRSFWNSFGDFCCLVVVWRRFRVTWAVDGKRFSDGRCIRIASRREFY